MKSVFFITRQSFFLFFMTFMLFVLSSGCGPQKKYTGPYLPDEELVIIRPTDKVFTHVKILSIDETEITHGPAGIAIHPGEHSMIMEAVLDYPFLDKYLYFEQSLNVNLEAGKKYTLHATILPLRNEGFAWISDDDDPEKMIVKKYAPAIIPLPNYP